MKPFPAPSENNVPSSPPDDSRLEVQPGLPVQCWLCERGLALTEMVVYFATGNLPHERTRSLSINFAKEGRRGRLKT